MSCGDKQATPAHNAGTRARTMFTSLPLSISLPSAPEPQAHIDITAAQGPLHFGEFMVTETTAFPPPPGPCCWVYVTLNAEIVLDAPRNAGLMALRESSRLRTSIDGQWLWWALRRKYPHRPLAKLSGSDLIHQVADLCEQNHQRLFLLGSSAKRNDKAVQVLRQRHPKLRVAGYAPAHYEPGGRGQRHVMDDIRGRLKAFRPDYVVLGLGAFKEHHLAATLAPLLDGQTRALLCFGGAIDMLSGEVQRAPVLWQRCGLEGLYRVWQQPQRLGRLLRVLRVLPRLVLGQY
jgi:exopolysaccharide biosynthesis WecB/TagA/CpsF family protein